jgi:hypothetical protein
MPRKHPPSPEVQGFLNALPAEARPLLETSTGPEIVEELGIDVVRGVVLDVLRGVNIRDSTETLTRKRLSLLNAATVAQYADIPGSDASIDEFLSSIAEAIRNARLSKGEKWVLYWTFGLNEKAVQNVLRDDHLSLDGYIERYLSVLRESAQTARQDFGGLSGTLRIGDREVPLNWFFVLYLSASLGAQTLAIRGAEKSLYGKLFEKLILGSVLSILGFRFVPSGPTDPSPGQFWLSTTSKRESDATLLIAPGQGVRFDIGFIGRGNPEITLDKVSRFERVAEFDNERYGMSTFIIVDTIPKKGNLEQRAQEIDGTVIQMSMTYWPRTLARHLNERFKEYCDDILDANDRRLEELIQDRLTNVPLAALLQKAAEDKN